jgi:hypothetical protein
MPQTPIVIFLYKRPHHARKLLDSLEKCSRLTECDIFIYCDGVKNPVDLAKVIETRSVAREFASKNNANVVEREHNMGLAQSIVGGVSQMCEKYGRVIILEEDFILHPYFLDFMLQSLDYYAADETVAQVAGFSFPIDKSANTDAFFMPIISIWGWATWQRAWNLFSWDTLSAVEALNANPQIQYKFNLDNSYPYSDMMFQVAKGQLDAWAILWYWQTFSKNKLTLFPRQSLVWQNGFDAAAVHTKEVWPGMQESLDKFLQVKWSNPISFPKNTETDSVAFESLKKFLWSKTQSPPPGIPFFKRLLKRTRAWISKLNVSP